MLSLLLRKENAGLLKNKQEVRKCPKRGQAPKGLPPPRKLGAPVKRDTGKMESKDNMLRQLLSKVARGTAVAVLVLLTISPLPCLAAGITSPTTQTVNEITAYQGVIYPLDQLYIVTFSLATANTTDYASDNFIFRFKDNTVEIASVAPYDFYNYGNADGVVSFYFAAGDADLPAWGSANISVEFTGNPTLTWADGDPPTVTNSTVDSWNDSASLIPAKVRLLANQLENAYNVDMVALLSGVLKLTNYGVLYFETVIQNLRLIAPSVFSDIVTQPQYTSDNHTLVTKTTLEDRLTGSVFDQTKTGTLLGISALWVSSLIWLLISGGIIFIYATRVGTIGLNWIVSLCCVVGAATGWMPLEMAVGVGILGGLLIIYPLFFRSASI